MRGGGNGGWRIKGGGNCEGRMKRWGRTIFGCFFFGSWFFTAISFEVSVNSNFCPDGYLKPPRFLPTSFQLTFQHADLLTSMVPLSCTRARSHKPWDERTQENLNRTLMFLPKMFAHNFILIVPYTDESWWWPDKMVPDKMARTQWYGQNGIRTKWYGTKWYGQNGMDKMVRTKW